MSKRENYKAKLDEILRESLSSGRLDELSQYLTGKSNLPGPRGNLELAEAFADSVTSFSQQNADSLWKISQTLSTISVKEAPVNNPREFLTFCGVRGLGVVGATSKEYYLKAVARLREMAHDSRWRVRESVAMSIQRLAKMHPEVLIELDGWVVTGDWLAMRAVVGSVADPLLLKNGDVAKHSLELHKTIFAEVLRSSDRKNEEFRTLRQALGYSLSVVVSAIPKEGFEYMRRLVGSGDPDILWIVKENLKKARLAKSYPQDVARIGKLSAG